MKENMKQNKTLAIIPARGGSTRIPRKNIKDFLGQPIMKYSINAAIQSGCFDEVMVSTDDKEIAEIAKAAGAKVPFLRSAKNSDSKSNLVDAFEEVIQEYQKLGKKFDSFCVILSTAPFVSADRIKLGLQKLVDNKADQVVSVVQYSFPIQRAFKIENDRLIMYWPENMHKHSQDLQPSYHDSGQFYWFDTESFLEQKKSFLDNAVPLELPESEVQDIDTMEDWKVAEIKFKMLKDSR